MRVEAPGLQHAESLAALRVGYTGIASNSVLLKSSKFGSVYPKMSLDFLGRLPRVKWNSASQPGN